MYIAIVGNTEKPFVTIPSITAIRTKIQYSGFNLNEVKEGRGKLGNLTEDIIIKPKNETKNITKTSIILLEIKELSTKKIVKEIIVNAAPGTGNPLKKNLSSKEVTCTLKRANLYTAAITGIEA